MQPLKCCQVTAAATKLPQLLRRDSCSCSSWCSTPIARAQVTGQGLAAALPRSPPPPLLPPYGWCCRGRAAAEAWAVGGGGGCARDSDGQGHVRSGLWWGRGQGLRRERPRGPGGPAPPEREVLGQGLGVEPRALRMPSRVWPWHRPRGKGIGKGLSRARVVHLTWHGWPICRAVREAIVLHPRYPVSREISSQIQIQIPANTSHHHQSVRVCRDVLEGGEAFAFSSPRR